MKIWNMKKRIFLTTILLLLSTTLVFAAWDPTKPADDGYLINGPSEIRSNFEAIALGTDPALQVTNAKVASNAAIADTKLATISTAGKVNASALFSASSLPYGAGQWPVANIPDLPGTKITSGEVAIARLPIDTDGTLAANSDSKIATQKAAKTYADTKISKTTAGEIAAMTEKTTPVAADVVVIEDSQASNAKKKIQIGNIPVTVGIKHYSSGWFPVSTGQTISKTHGLNVSNPKNIISQIWFSSASDGSSNVFEMWADSNSTIARGCQIEDLTTTNFNLVTGTSYVAVKLNPADTWINYSTGYVDVEMWALE